MIYRPHGLLLYLLLFRWCNKDNGGSVDTYIGLVLADIHLVHDLAGLIRVSDILEGLGGILAGLIDKNLLSTGMLYYHLKRIRGEKIVSVMFMLVVGSRRRVTEV